MYIYIYHEWNLNEVGKQNGRSKLVFFFGFHMYMYSILYIYTLVGRSSDTGAGKVLIECMYTYFSVLIEHMHKHQ